MRQRAQKHLRQEERKPQDDERNPARDLGPGRPGGHAPDRIGNVTSLTSRARTGRPRAAVGRPPAWDWTAFEDGALALEPRELWEEPAHRRRPRVTRAGDRQAELKAVEAFVTVPRMPSPRASPARARRPQHRRAAPRAHRFGALAVVACVAAVTLALTAFGTGPSQPVAAVVATAPARLLPPGPPAPQVVALRGPLRIQLPVAQSRVTAVGYHGAGDGALPLQPVGRLGNPGLLGRLAERVLGRERGTPVYYQLSGGEGPATSALDVGAAPGTDVFSPVYGIVVGITDFVLNGKRYGVRLDLHPARAPSLVVSLTRLRLDPALTVGSSVIAGRSKVGTLLDLSRVERQALARYTQDAGNHVSVEVRPAAALALP